MRFVYSLLCLLLIAAAPANDAAPDKAAAKPNIAAPDKPAQKN